MLRSFLRIKNIVSICWYDLFQSALLLMLCMTSSWGYSTSSCGLSRDPGGTYDSPQSALDAASAYSGYPFAAANEAQVCKGQWIEAHWILGQPIVVDPFYGYGGYSAGRTIWPFIGEAIQGQCERGVDGISHVVSTRKVNFELYTTAVCAADLAVGTLTLTGPTDARPLNTPGAAPVAFTAVVASGNQPKGGVLINFSVDVTPNSGGHEHHDVARPKGKLSPIQGTTDANGEVKLIFTAPEVSGIHTIKATCATCSNSPAAKEIMVKVPDLVPISPNSPRNADGSYAYALTSVDGIHAGEGRYHKNQYYLTEQARQNLRALIDSFGAAGWGTVALNDASLYWGGRYDIKGNWGGPHQGHRDGREIDISFTRANNPISTSKQNDFYDKFCKDKATEAAFSILHHFVKVPHFHVYLDKQKTCNRTEN